MKICKTKVYRSGTQHHPNMEEHIYLPSIENQADVFAIPTTAKQSHELISGRPAGDDGYPLISGHVLAGIPHNQSQLLLYAEYAKEKDAVVILHVNSGVGFINAGVPASSARYVSIARLDGDVLVPCLDIPTLCIGGYEIDRIDFGDLHESYTHLVGIFVNSCPGGYGGVNEEGPCGPHFRIETIRASNKATQRGRPAQIIHSSFYGNGTKGYPYQLVTFQKDGKVVTNTVNQYLNDADDYVGSETYDFFWNML